MEHETNSKFIISVCGFDETIYEKLKLEELFPNANLVISKNYIIDDLIDKGWIDSDNIYKEQEKDSIWRRVERTIISKGDNWESCPDIIKEHLEKLKN